MRAAVCRSFGSPLVIEEVHLADPGPGEVKVRMEATAICHSAVEEQPINPTFPLLQICFCIQLNAS